MTEVDYTAGYTFFANLGKGIGLLGLKVTGVATTETITTPFMRCVPVATNGAAFDVDLDGASDAAWYYISESGGVVTFTTGAACATFPATWNVLIMGAMY